MKQLLESSKFVGKAIKNARKLTTEEVKDGKVKYNSMVEKIQHKIAIDRKL